MKPYTKTGDEGFTNRLDGRLRKSDPRLEAGGTVDELSAHVGSCVQSAGQLPDVREALAAVQVELFAVGAILAGAKPKTPLGESAVERMEKQIDAAWDKLPELTRFVIPGGCEAACRLQVACTVCRRAERAIVAAADADHEVAPIILKYVNRLGDLLFALARLANFQAKTPEQTLEQS